MMDICQWIKINKVIFLRREKLFVSKYLKGVLMKTTKKSSLTFSTNINLSNIFILRNVHRQPIIIQHDLHGGLQHFLSNAAVVVFQDHV